jgi:GxxExxY protein
VAVQHESLTHSVIGAFFEVYNRLGPGYPERLHATALHRELVRRGHSVAREHCTHVFYKGEPHGVQRLDMVVDDVLVVEIKSTAMLARVAHRQLLSYLRSTKLEVGLLHHFGPTPRCYRVACLNDFETRDPERNE